MTDAFNNVKLCSYLFAADSYENGKKIIDSFIPLIESTIYIMGEKEISFLDLQNRINELYCTDIPKATLKNLLKHLSAEKKITIERNRLKIIDGIFDSEYYNSMDRKGQEVNDLFLDFREYLLNVHNIKITVEESKKSICSFVFTHCYDLSDFIDRSIKPELSLEEDDTPISYLCEFLFECRSNKKKSYNAFLRLYKGAVQATLLRFNPKRIKSLQTMNFKINKAILDSNFVMRVLDIQDEYESIASQETIRIMQRKGIELIVLPESLLEISSSIKSFLHDLEPYTHHTREYLQHQTIRTSGLLSAYQRGKGRVKLLELSKISILKEKLQSDFNITILDDEFEINEKHKNDIEDLIKAKDKYGYGYKQAAHDIALVYYCRSLRKKITDIFSEVKEWVLTSDIKLTFWNQNNCKGVQECITEGQFSNLLWFESPKEDNVGLANTMVALSTKVSVDSISYYDFINKMQWFKEENKDNEEVLDNLALIFACDCMTTTDIKRINEDQSNVNKIINEKVEVLRKQKELEVLKLKENKDENDKLKLGLRKSKLETKEQKLLGELTKCDAKIFLNASELIRIKQKRKDTVRIKATKRASGRVLGIIMFSVLAATALLMWWLLPKIIFKLTEYPVDFFIPEWLCNILLTIALTGMLTFIASAAIVIFTSEVLGFKGVLKYIKNKIYNSMLVKRGLPKDIKFEDFDDYMRDIDKEIEETNKNVNEFNIKKQDIEHELKHVRMDLDGINDL